MLCSCGADPNLGDNERRTPLHLALSAARCEATPAIVAALLAAGADYDRADRDGVKPADFALVQDVPAVAQTLAERRARAREAAEAKAREDERRRLRALQTALVDPDTQARVQAHLAGVARAKAAGARCDRLVESVEDAHAKDVFLAGLYSSVPATYVPPKPKKRKKRSDGRKPGARA